MFVVKWYTRASRVRIVIAKFDGRWKIPGGPYPIPELVALLSGVLTTLFLLPRLGHPALTAVVGVVTTAGLVALMRRMPYSPVKFSTRVHRIVRLYTSPRSFSTRVDMRASNTVSVVRPCIEILDPVLVDAAGPIERRAQTEWVGIFDHPRSAAAELFG